MDGVKACEAILVELNRAGLELYAAPPGWTLSITPKGIVSEVLKADIVKHKDRLTWWTIQKRYEPDELTWYFLHNIANGPNDMRERVKKHRKDANKMNALGESEQLQESALAYRAIMIAARTAAKVALPDGVPK